MTPSNPSNDKPFIFRFFDSLGIAHLCAALNHTHSQSEVSGLESALAGKASASDMTTSLAAKADKVANATNNNFAALDGNGNIKDSGKKATDFANSIPSGGPSGAIVIVSNSGQIGRSDKTLSNLMPATTIDTTPTADSDHLVTSGGVKAALDGKAPEGDTEVIFEEGENLFVYLPNYFSNGERQRSFILNYQGEPTELIDLFGCSTHDMIRILSHDDSTITVGECYIAVRVIKQPGGVSQGDVYYIIFDGKNDY